MSDLVQVGSRNAELTTMYSQGFLLLCGAPWNGHFVQEYLKNTWSRRAIVALSADDGRELWSTRIGYRSRPLVVGEKIIAEPWAYELRTGKPIMRQNPVTGLQEKWQMARGGGGYCGPLVASAHTVFFRGWSLAYHDLVKDYGTAAFGGVRPGCTNNCLPAGGVLALPEGAAYCVCPFPVQATVVLRPSDQTVGWGKFSASNVLRPVKHLAINLGAPGDRRDEEGVLWFSHPRPGGGMFVSDPGIHVTLVPGGRYFRYDADGVRFAGVERPWIWASGCLGLKEMIVPVSEKGESGVYHILLGFMGLQGDLVGQRVFDVKIEGKVVLRDFDVARAAGEVARPVTRVFKGIRAEQNLHIELIPKTQASQEEEMPVLNSVEIIRQN